MAAGRSLLFEFVGEAKEHLAAVSDDLLALEQQQQDDAARYRVDRLFRAVHSVKGGAGFFGCRTLERLAHLMETVLESVRLGERTPSADMIDALLAVADRMLALLDDVERSGEADVSAVEARLRQFTEAPRVESRGADSPRRYRLTIDLAECQRRQGLTPVAVIRRLQDVGAVLDARLEVPEVDLDTGLSTGPLWYHVELSTALAPERVGRTLALPALRVEPVEQPAHAPAELPPPAAPAPASSTLRIPVGLVDRLMTLAGELVLVRNQAVRAIDVSDPVLGAVTQRLDAVTAELQDAVMQTRMQPIGNLFGRFPRLVRDLARQLGKEIELDLSGAEVELDKSVLEVLADPLTHLVRNCCDHGIETPDQRLRSGKTPAGRVALSARQVGGQIFLTVRDDGRGLDVDAVRRKAARQGTRAPAELERMSEKEVVQLILLPGFSTASALTDVSGRGVGMDVVKTNLDRLGGALDIDSRPGRGITFTLRLPLTLAIIPCLLVRVGGERYAVPQKDLEELVCLHPALTRDRIERTHEQEVVRLRGQLLPLVRLGEVLARPAPFDANARAEILANYPEAKDDHAPVFFAVVKFGARRFGLIVDAILNTEEIVVKPMHAALKGVAIYSGATVLGDGRVSLILNLEGIGRHAGVRFEEDAGAAAALFEDRGGEKQSVLLFRCGPREQFAVPLAVVRRIDRVSRERIENVGGREFVTLDGVPTAVLRPDALLAVSPCPDRDELLLLLPRGARRPVGLLLSEVIDTPSLVVELNTEAYRPDGVLGTAVVSGQMTIFLDLHRLAELGDRGQPTADSKKPTGRRVLLVEDTQFFREVVKGHLESAGYAVTTAGDGAEGLAAFDSGQFDAVVSDIEMPVMDGWTFARELRRRPGGAAVPLLALTTLSSDADRERAAACGYDRHEVKLDRDRFLAAVAELLRKE